MTRRQQIEAACDKAMSERAVIGDIADVELFDCAFTWGAEWSDANPADKTIKRIVALYKRWYTTESCGSVEDYVRRHWQEP